MSPSSGAKPPIPHYYPLQSSSSSVGDWQYNDFTFCLVPPDRSRPNRTFPSPTFCLGDLHLRVRQPCPQRYWMSLLGMLGGTPTLLLPYPHPRFHCAPVRFHAADMERCAWWETKKEGECCAVQWEGTDRWKRM